MYLNAETGIRTQGGVTLAGFQDRCLKPTRPSLLILIISNINYLTGLEGFEPSHAGIKILCLTAWR